MEPATSIPVPCEPPLERAAASPWAIVEIAPDALPAPVDGYVDLFEGEPVEESGRASAAPFAAVAPSAPAPSPAPPLEPRRSPADVAPPRLASPETLLLVLFLAAGGAIGALAHGRAAALGAPPERSPVEVRGVLRADADPSDPPARPRPAARRAASGAAPRGEPTAARAEPLPPAAAPEPGPVHDPAADARDVPAPALASTVQRVAAALADRAAIRRARLADPRCLSALRLPAGASAVDRAKVRVVVEPDGSASSIEVLSGATDPALADAIRAAASACRFVPASDATGSPVRLDHVLAIDFVPR